ncbi:MAG: hypothetical protein R3E65_03090 [Steroidobacteraceae bacterium]
MPPAVAAAGNEPRGVSGHAALLIAVLASLAVSALIWWGNASLADWRLAQREPGGPRIYPWQLADPGFWSRATAWIGYLLHQVAIWALIWRAQRAGLGYTTTLKRVNVAMFAATAGFVLLHFVQTQLCYDGLAQDVPEWTAMWSVILLLLVVVLLENRRRGVAFGWRVGGFMAEAGDVARRYHGYYFAWATIYTFWYHPMVFTSGHALGFLYMFLLFTQGALLYTRAHLNRWWTATLEVLVIVHGVVVALMNADGLWTMFGFGLAGIFFITQGWGLGLSRRWSWLLFASYAAAVAGYYAARDWQGIAAVFRIPLGYVVALPVLAVSILIIHRLVRRRPKRGAGVRASLPLS